MDLSHTYTALVTVLALLMFYWTLFNVGMARGKYGVSAPATTGNPDFERAYRVQQNTLEYLVVFLPALWLFSYSFGDFWAAGFGAVWVIGRIWYALSYYKAAEARGKGFLVSVLPIYVLVLGSLAGVVMRLAEG